MTRLRGKSHERSDNRRRARKPIEWAGVTVVSTEARGQAEPLPGHARRVPWRRHWDAVRTAVERGAAGPARRARPWCGRSGMDSDRLQHGADVYGAVLGL